MIRSLFGRCGGYHSSSFEATVRLAIRLKLKMGCFWAKPDVSAEVLEERALRAAKRQQQKYRRSQLKAKRTSALACKEWDPSGTNEQGPTSAIQFNNTSDQRLASNCC
jgi:hypothetical protein